MFPPYAAQAFMVGDVPTGNLLMNPWFHSAADPQIGAFDHWIPDAHWSISDKESNPSPDDEEGSSVKIGPTNRGGNGTPNVPGYLYQVVAANPAHTQLQFSTWWIGVKHTIFEVVIYGSASAQGPWQPVWTPLSESSDPGGWVNTGLQQTTLSQGYPFYKVEIKGQFPEGSLGVKVTGVYFSAVGTSTEEPPIEKPPTRNDPTRVRR